MLALMHRAYAFLVDRQVFMNALRSAPFLPDARFAHGPQTKVQHGLQGTSSTYSYTSPPYSVKTECLPLGMGPFRESLTQLAHCHEKRELQDCPHTEYGKRIARPPPYR